MPWMWIVAGPNGSGKTTLVKTGVVARVSGISLMHINPDTVAARINQEQPGIDADEASRRAAQESDELVDLCIDQGTSFVVETVLSTDKFKARVLSARACGFSIGLIFVVLVNPELSIQRVKLRVGLHGHDVPPERIRDRWHKSISNLSWFANQADRVRVFDNSEDRNPVLLAAKTSGEWTFYTPGRLPEVDAALKDS
jgi:predicted ABC-type ATPase